ncbi:MAG TPA: hypothetical protein VEQ85_00600 [Lacipirellulaceae bacterium]|nr:hypothetical protein [Lacipirellulaceae bacterium]
MPTATMHAGRAGADQHEGEGAVARAIEQYTVKIPSDAFLWAAGASIVGSLTLQCLGAGTKANFVGQWAPTFLILGLYNKLVKLHGSE